MKNIVLIALLLLSPFLLSKDSSKKNINNHLFSSFVNKIENNYLKKLRLEKDSKKRLLIEKEMNIIKLGQRSKAMWNSLSFKDQEEVKKSFRRKLEKKKKSDSKIIMRLFEIDVGENQVVYSVNTLAGLMRNIQNKNNFNESLMSQIDIRNHEMFKNDKDMTRKFEVYIKKNLTRKDQQEIIDLYNKSSNKLALQKKIINLFKDSLKP